MLYFANDNNWDHNGGSVKSACAQKVSESTRKTIYNFRLLFTEQWSWIYLCPSLRSISSGSKNVALKLLANCILAFSSKGEWMGHTPVDLNGSNWVEGNWTAFLGPWTSHLSFEKLLPLGKLAGSPSLNEFCHIGAVPDSCWSTLNIEVSKYMCQLIYFFYYYILLFIYLSKNKIALLVDSSLPSTLKYQSLLITDPSQILLTFQMAHRPSCCHNGHYKLENQDTRQVENWFMYCTTMPSSLRL